MTQLFFILLILCISITGCQNKKTQTQVKTEETTLSNVTLPSDFKFVVTETKENPGSESISIFVEINKMLINKDNKANFNCTLCVINLEKTPLYFVGKTYGEILSSPRGDNNFGYDPIFFYPPLNRTFAELTQEEKNKVSHRGNALKQFVDYLKEKNYI